LSLSASLSLPLSLSHHILTTDFISSAFKQIILLEMKNPKVFFFI
jgi:hypothetical protein